MSNKNKTLEKARSAKSSRASFVLATVLAMSLGIGSGVAHGWLDGRWVHQANLQAVGSQLDRLPQKLGDWVLLQEGELPESAQAMLHCYGHTVRTYQNSQTGSRINLALLFGPRGPIAVHIPEICYSSRGVTQEHERQEVTIDAGGAEHTLWKLNFVSAMSDQPEFQVYYAWSDGGPWQASKYPRFWLSDRLYKLQLSGPPSKPGGASECNDFLEQLLPALAPLMQSERPAS